MSWSWTTITFRVFLLIDTLFVVVLFMVSKFRFDQLNKYKTHHQLNDTNHHHLTFPGGSNDTNSTTYVVTNFDPDNEPIVKRLNDNIGFYTVITTMSIIRILFGLIHTIKFNADRRQSKLIGYSALISLVNMVLCIVLTIMYHEDIGIDLERDLENDIRDGVDANRYCVDLIVGLAGVTINLSALIINCGYDCFGIIEQQEMARRLRRETLNRVLRERRRRQADASSNTGRQTDANSNTGRGAIRDGDMTAGTMAENDVMDTRSERRLISVD